MNRRGRCLKKGRSVLVEGKIQYRKWQDKNGHDRYTTDIIAQRVLFINSRSQSQGQMAGDQYEVPGQQYSAPNQQPMTADPFANPRVDPMGSSASSFPQNTPSSAPQVPTGGPSLDDIPF